jgi:predicted DNA-binding transcriptional regulator AlpA
MNNTATMAMPIDSRKSGKKSPDANMHGEDRRVSLAYLGELYSVTPKMVRRYLSREGAPQPIRIGVRVIRYRLSEATAFLDSQLAPK